ncbi:neuronal acetylcholine receptor subunit alpha-10-like [Lineus longissimus]|uniref:neuronal acetylcholine receptor subunit alpha-10-like n=1 Tax=Lineus longissimus TaxID=88925 RepID=UPI002B4C3559
MTFGHHFVKIAVIAASLGIGCSAFNDENRLLKKLLDGYDRAVRPVRQFRDTLNVSVRITANQFRDLDEPHQHLVISIWFQFFWNDHHLQWKPSEYNNVTAIRLQSSRIWRPDIVLFNSVDEERKPNEIFSDTNAIINSNGRVAWLTPALVKATCKVDVTYFPFDYQVCPLKMGSWSYDGLQLDVHFADPAYDSSKFMANGEWELHSIRTKRSVLYYICCPEPFPDLTWYLVIHRMSLFYVYNLIIPCVLITITAIMVFYLPPETGEKVSLGVTVLLAMTVFLLLIAETMPPTSEVVPVIGKFFGATIILLSLSTAVTVVVLNFHFNGEHGKEAPEWLRKVVLVYVARYIFMEKFCQRILVNFKVQKAMMSNKQRAGSVVLTNFHANSAPNDSTFFYGVNGGMPEGASLEHNIDAENTTDWYFKIHAKVYSEISNTLRSVKESLTQRIDRSDYRDLCRAEWQMIALVMDRVLLIVFFTIATITSIAIFAGIPTAPPDPET